MTPLAVATYTVVSALGAGRDATWAAVQEQRTGLARQRFVSAELDTWLGVAAGLDDTPLAAEFDAFDCRNNRLAERALHCDGFAAAVAASAARHGPHRVGVFLGTSTAGILSTEVAYRQRDVQGALPAGTRYAGTHDTYSVAAYVRAALRLRGPAQVVSTACSSSAKVFATAARMLALGLVDAAVVGGVDSLCLTTLYGFRSLELLASDICRPWDTQRTGLSLGEGAAFALLEREPQGAPLGWLLGTGESSDAHHMSSPHPEGAGAAAAMRAALADAALAPQAVGYINLHGTGTPNNDAAEDYAVLQVFGPGVACSSTKGHTGHALGAAGAVEAAISLLSLAHGTAPGGLNLRQRDAGLHARYLHQNEERRLQVVASNSFGFGGTNACLLFGAAA